MTLYDYTELFLKKFIIIIVMTVYTYGSNIATTTRGVGRDPGAVRNSLRKKIIIIIISTPINY